MIKSKYILFDCETGGLNKDANPITQFAAVILDPKTLKELDRFETFVQPYNDLKIESQAIAHTMVSMSDINRGMPVEKFCSTLVTWLESHRAKTKERDMGRLIPVGHNIPFDIGFVNYALEYTENGSIYEYMYPNAIDTLAIAKLVWGVEGSEKLNLTACCERAKIKLTDAHGAMNDVLANADLFRWYMKKLRAVGKGAAEETTSAERARGSEFFEFKCGAK